jgi:hypothetical protein
MDITEEVLETIYRRAIAYCVAKHGSEPSELELEDGYLEAGYETYCCGESETEYHNISAECLTQDLDEVHAEREKQKEIDRIKAREASLKLEKERKEIDTRNRKRQYEELKNEFEPKQSKSSGDFNENRESQAEYFGKK